MINKVILVGNVGSDPDVRTLEGGVKTARIRLATTERIYNRQTQEARDHTEWHTVTLWRNLADVADRFVRKGSQIYIEGRLRSRDWTDEAGNRRFSVEIMADDLKLLGRRGDSQQGGGYGSRNDNAQGGYGSRNEGQGGYGPQSSGYGPRNHGPQSEGYGNPQPQPTAPQSAPQSAPAPADDVDDLPF